MIADAVIRLMFTGQLFVVVIGAIEVVPKTVASEEQQLIADNCSATDVAVSFPALDTASVERCRSCFRIPGFNTRATPSCW